MQEISDYAKFLQLNKGSKQGLNLGRESPSEFVLILKNKRTIGYVCVCWLFSLKAKQIISKWFVTGGKKLISYNLVITSDRSSTGKRNGACISE